MMSASQHADLVRRIRGLLEPLAPVPTGISPRLQQIPGMRAVLFDIYGTLLISGSGDVGAADARDNAAALAEALPAAGIAILAGDAPAEGIRRFDEAVHAAHRRGRAQGRPHPEIEVRRIWRHVLRTLARDQYIAIPAGDPVHALAVEYEGRANPVAAMPGFPEVPTQLAEAGLALGIVSNAQFYTPLTLEAAAGRPPARLGFPPNRCAWSYQHRIAKPDPSLFTPVLSTLRQAGILPEQTLYIGNDMRNDVQAASARGLRTILFAGDRRSLRTRPDDPLCRHLTPDAVITHLAQLPALLSP